MKTGPKPLSDLTKHRGIETIRQIQHLMLLCSLLPPGGKLHEILRLALSVHDENLPAHVSPVRDLHPQATKDWLESIWDRADISDEERELVVWQSDKPNMDAAAEELQRIERLLGIRLATEIVK
ncbi:hypothetical protein GCM10023085_56400 [Actinomadura viridis]|uniref:Uncharacterized protein n=1 Tax=Actinomadura viridis TaxID=58110 RepID=A0A931GK11_9ACTN|nr:DurN family substrate-assisted peptide maturase [Actinomadura viridis]MBG6085911.1 hypothetical protein [Actinomadura viridis]